MDLLQTLGQTLYPGQRIPRVKGWTGAVNYHIPRDCEATLLDQDNPDIVYFKKNDANGNEETAWYDIHERAIPEFDPDKYVSMNLINQYGNGDPKQAFLNYASQTGKQGLAQQILQKLGLG